MLQNVYLCSSKHNQILMRCICSCVVNCFKMCIFAVASTIDGVDENNHFRCELLQNVYLCSSKHNFSMRIISTSAVVNCFKMCIFAVASTMLYNLLNGSFCCELLQNVYLCSSKHNISDDAELKKWVVNCFKMCIFAVASTIKSRKIDAVSEL